MIRCSLFEKSDVGTAVLLVAVTLVLKERHAIGDLAIRIFTPTRNRAITTEGARVVLAKG